MRPVPPLLVAATLLFWGWQERKGRIDSQESRIRETRDQAEKFYKAITALSAIEEAYKRGVR